MQRVIATSLMLVTFAITGCTRDQTKPQESKGVNITAPGVNVQVEKGNVGVKAPGVDVNVTR